MEASALNIPTRLRTRPTAAVKADFAACWQEGQACFVWPHNTLEDSETSKFVSTAMHHNNPKEKQNSKSQIYSIQRQDSKSGMQLLLCCLKYYLSLCCFFNKHNCSMSCRQSLYANHSSEKIPLSHPHYCYFLFECPQFTHWYLHSKSMRLHVHEFAQLAPEPTQPVTLRIDVTRVLYMDDYNY